MAMLCITDVGKPKSHQNMSLIIGEDFQIEKVENIFWL